MRSLSRWLIVVAVFALIAAACGDSSEDTTATTQAPTTTVVVVEVEETGPSDPAPVTNKPEEAKGSGENVPPPAAPAPDSGLSLTMTWEERMALDALIPVYEAVDESLFTTTTMVSGPVPAEAPPSSPATVPLATLPQVTVESIGPNDPLPPVGGEPHPLRQRVFDTVTAVGDWLADVIDWFRSLG